MSQKQGLQTVEALPKPSTTDTRPGQTVQVGKSSTFRLVENKEKCPARLFVGPRPLPPLSPKDTTLTTTVITDTVPCIVTLSFTLVIIVPCHTRPGRPRGLPPEPELPRPGPPVSVTTTLLLGSLARTGPPPSVPLVRRGDAEVVGLGAPGLEVHGGHVVPEGVGGVGRLGGLVREGARPAVGVVRAAATVARVHERHTLLKENVHVGVRGALLSEPPLRDVYVGHAVLEGHERVGLGGTAPRVGALRRADVHHARVQVRQAPGHVCVSVQGDTQPLEEQPVFAS